VKDRRRSVCPEDTAILVWKELLCGDQWKGYVWVQVEGGLVGGCRGHRRRGGGSGELGGWLRLFLAGEQISKE